MRPTNTSICSHTECLQSRQTGACFLLCNWMRTDRWQNSILNHQQSCLYKQTFHLSRKQCHMKKNLKSWPNTIYPIRLTSCGWNSSERQVWHGLTLPELKWGAEHHSRSAGNPSGLGVGDPRLRGAASREQQSKSKRLNSIFKRSVYCKENDPH